MNVYTIVKGIVFCQNSFSAYLHSAGFKPSSVLVQGTTIWYPFITSLRVCKFARQLIFLFWEKQHEIAMADEVRYATFELKIFAQLKKSYLFNKDTRGRGLTL
jgi:hypothetical protein